VIEPVPGPISLDPRRLVIRTISAGSEELNGMTVQYEYEVDAARS
jgi:hypothetical protein